MCEIVRRKDKNLTKMARNIFGDIIAAAYVTTWDIESPKKEMMSRIKLNHYESIDTEIDIGGKDIIISFKNGKSVYFTNSEWGRISEIDLSEVHEI